ncbi:MAG: hypothetical protein IPH85_02735 [Ignavibacteria bacterium]|nr:hypothetical protein [Ignavibacteria bacterium]
MNHPSPVRRLTTFVLFAVICSVAAFSQAPSRLPLITGVSGMQTFVHADTTIWMADGSVVYRNVPSSNMSWSAMPQLYRTASAFIVRATPTVITVVAKRFTSTDSSWWSFTSDGGGQIWLDSLKLDATGSILGSTSDFLLFSDSPSDSTMSIAVWRYDGSFATTVLMSNVRNSVWATARQCGDSIIVSDPTRAQSGYEVIRNVDQEPSAWTAHTLDAVQYGFVGDGNSFVFLKNGVASIDHGGTVKPLGVFQDRIQDLYVDGLKAARIGGGGLETTSDITGDSSQRYALGPLLTPGLDIVFTLRRGYAGIVRSSYGILATAADVVDGSTTHRRLVPSMIGTRTRGTKSILSGDRVVIGEYYQQVNSWEVDPSIGSLTADPSGNSLEPLTQVETSAGLISLWNVNDEVWAGTNDGTFTFPNYTRVSNRTAYDVVGGGDRVFMLTNRGIEVREGSDSTFRVFVDEQAPAGFAVAGDTLVVVRIEDITIDEPEARWVVDAYDRLGNVMFYGALLADSVVKSGLRWRSIITSTHGLLINGQERLFRSVNGGASWTTVDPGLTLTTSLSAADERVCSWGIRSDGTEGPCLMISPDRWVMQPAVLRTPRPVIACASMPGWFVFSTADGLYQVKQTISSVWESPLQGASEIPVGAVPDETTIVDLMGRICDSQENLPSGLYVVTQRFGEIVRSHVRLFVK